MSLKKITRIAILPLFFFPGCKGESPKKVAPKEVDTVQMDTVKKVPEIADPEPFKLNEENAITFFFDYQKGLTQNKVKIQTSLGDFTVQLYDNVPYHKANFIFLARKGYFNDTQFHRIVKDFIIQGGNSDDLATSKKRGEIGRYLLPPDTRKGHKHHRGTLSMPSSKIDNPHMLASPYEFFIVVARPGSYHLDGEYTPFGKVIEGMDVVDNINRQPVGKGDWPHQNIYIKKMEVLD